MNITQIIESILFVASKPLSIKKITDATGESIAAVEDALTVLTERYNTSESGIHILRSDDTLRMGTNPTCAQHIEQFVKDEVAGELTRAQLETLSVIAYTAPITRPEIEEIRGVNCSVILRNLMIRGLITEGASEKKVLPVYTLSMEAMRHLGIDTTEDLPEYAALHDHPHLSPTEIE